MSDVFRLIVKGRKADHLFWHPGSDTALTEHQASGYLFRFDCEKFDAQSIWVVYL
jgi:hypothetical protein